MATEEQVRQMAYALWEVEGRPDGKQEEHYYRARQLLMMFCSVGRVHVSPQDLDRVVNIFQRVTLPLYPKYPGFRGAYLMTKPSGELMILDIWDTEQQADAWPQTPDYQYIMAQLKPFFIDSVARDRYDVRANAAR